MKEVLVASGAHVIEIGMRVHVLAFGTLLCVKLFGLLIVLGHWNIIIRMQGQRYYKKRGFETAIIRNDSMINSVSIIGGMNNIFVKYHCKLPQNSRFLSVLFFLAYFIASIFSPKSRNKG